METKRNRRFPGRTENPFKSPSFSWTIMAIFVLTILNAMDSADGVPRKVPDQYTTGSDPNFWGDLAAKGNEKGWDVVESVSEEGTLDRYARSLVLILGRVVTIQSLASLMSANGDEVSNEVRWVHGKRYRRFKTTDSLFTFYLLFPSLPSSRQD
jgi:NADPH:quinone reductase-like Zn-dependent oxidoreductase